MITEKELGKQAHLLTYSWFLDVKFELLIDDFEGVDNILVW